MNMNIPEILLSILLTIILLNNIVDFDEDEDE
jgi:hypothetical protein